MQSTSLWRSERLLYRGAEKDDEKFLTKLENDSEAYQNSSPHLPIPRSSKSAEGFRTFLDKCLLGCLVCIPSQEDPDDPSKSTPIGIVHLCGGTDPSLAHHRRSEVGVSISRPYQGQGYGTETIKWVTRWAFKRGNLHRLSIGAFAWNTGALKLYESLGFIKEAVYRDYFWHDGKYHDSVQFAMLEDEWRELYDRPQDSAPTEK